MTDVEYGYAQRYVYALLLSLSFFSLSLSLFLLKIRFPRTSAEDFGFSRSLSRSFVRRYQALVEKHFTQAVTQNLPERLGRLDEPEMSTFPSSISLPKNKTSKEMNMTLILPFSAL